MKLFKILLISSLIIPSVVTTSHAKNLNQDELISKLSTQLVIENIDVEFELRKTMSEYENDILYETNQSEISKLKNLKLATEKLLNDYLIISNKNTYANPPNVAVTMVVAYFSNKKYYLSRELLLQSTLNTNKNSTYKPSNGSVIKSTSAIKKIANGTSTSGSSIFSSTSTVSEGDAKYALHRFKYTKSSSNSRTVKVTDYYDFASGDYNGLEGLAVDAMVNAQKNGSIVPYNVSITVTVN